MTMCVNTLPLLISTFDQRETLLDIGGAVRRRLNKRRREATQLEVF